MMPDLAMALFELCGRDPVLHHRRTPAHAWPFFGRGTAFDDQAEDAAVDAVPVI